MSKEYKTKDGEVYVHGEVYWDVDEVNYKLDKVDTSEYEFEDGIIDYEGGYYHWFGTRPSMLYKNKNNALEKLVRVIDKEIQELEEIKQEVMNEYSKA